GRPVPHRLLAIRAHAAAPTAAARARITRHERKHPMCGLVGLHLRNPDLHSRLGELLTGMLCEMSNRGSDSAGVAVYGDPVWTPPGRGCVSLHEAEGDAESIGTAVASALGASVDVTELGDTRLL